MAEKKRYFKKLASENMYNDVVFEYARSRHDIKSLESRFIECDANGKEFKKVAKKAKKKGSK